MSAILKFIFFIFIASVCFLLFGHFILGHTSTLFLSQTLIKYHWAFTIWRYLIYVLALIFWPYIVELIGTRKNWQPQTIIYLSNQRVKLFWLFVIIEVFFVYNLVGRVIGGM